MEIINKKKIEKKEWKNNPEILNIIKRLMNSIFFCFMFELNLKNLSGFIPPYIMRRRNNEICHRKRRKEGVDPEEKKVINHDKFFVFSFFLLIFQKIYKQFPGKVNLLFCCFESLTNN